MSRRETVVRFKMTNLFVVECTDAADSEDILVKGRIYRVAGFDSGGHFDLIDVVTNKPLSGWSMARFRRPGIEVGEAA